MAKKKKSKTRKKAVTTFASGYPRKMGKLKIEDSPILQDMGLAKTRASEVGGKKAKSFLEGYTPSSGEKKGLVSWGEIARQMGKKNDDIRYKPRKKRTPTARTIAYRNPFLYQKRGSGGAGRVTAYLTRQLQRGSK